MFDLSKPRSVLAPLLATSLLLLIAFSLAGDWTRIHSVMFNAQFGWVLAAVCISGFIFPLWSWQWQLLLFAGSRPSHHEMLAIVASNSIVSSFFAPGAGAAVAAVMLVEKGVRPSATASLLLADQMATAVVKLLVITFAVLLAPVPQTLSGTIAVLAASAIALFALIVVLLCSGPWLSTLVLGTWPPARTLVRFAASVSRGLAAIGEARRTALVLALALAKKALEWTMIVAVQFACGMGFDPVLALAVLAAASVSTMIPVVGGFGLLAAGAAGAYLLLGIEGPTAIAAGILISLVDLPFAVGFVALGQLKHQNPAGRKL